MNLAIIQARMGSTRLPGKVLKQLHGKPLLQNLIDRIKPSRKIDELIVATTTNKEDDELVQYCNKNNIPVFRGESNDVLDRFYQAAISFKQKPKTIVRICCDNPLLTHKVVDFVINEFNNSGKDYFSNSNEEPDYLEDGFDVEVFTFKSLEIASEKALLPSDREHVCPYIKKNFSCGWKKSNSQYNYKLSVDTQNDFDAVERIFSELRDINDFGIEDVVSLLSKKKEILEINSSSEINSGYKKSLEKD